MNRPAPEREFVIEPMRDEVLAAVCELERVAGLSSLGVEGYRRKLAEGNSILLAAFAVEETKERGKLAGLLSGWVVADEFQIDNLIVAGSYRRRGIGSAMLAEGLRRAVKKGAVKAVLEVRASNLAARALYLRHGFSVVGRRAGYYSFPREEALTLSAELTGRLADCPANRERHRKE